VWLEPEGLNSDVIYPNGISMGFPREIQELIIRSIPGLEQVRILHPASSIESYADLLRMLTYADVC
jgi:tRNA uridine 5-carboxymethylaminomethyl modification enzyme